MALIGSVNPGHGTAACLHYTWNDIYVQMTQVYFTVVASVEASSPLKVLSFNAWALFIMNYHVWASFVKSFNYHELYFMWTEFTMNDVEHWLMWTYMNPEWHLNECEMIWAELK